MQINQILEVRQVPKIGEMRLWRGSRSMCVNPRVHYAGGIGPLWATEGVLLEFSLGGLSQYFRGFCRKVDPKSKTVVITITQGNTWGSFVQGSDVSISAYSFSRCHLPDPESPSLVDLACIKESEILAKQAFFDLSVQEIGLCFKNELSNQMKKLIGCEDYQWLNSIFYEYNKLRTIAVEAGPWFIDHPNKEINKQISKLKNTISKDSKH